MLSDIGQYTIFGMPLINVENFGYLFLKLGTDLFFTLIIIRSIFYPIYREINYVFTTILINVAVFLICFMLASIKLKIGFAFGLFAVFSIIRYRTEQIPIREMTYLFTVIILAVLNALSTGSLSYAELLLANTAVLVTVFLLEKNFLYNRELVQRITYEKIELIKPENYSRLIADLKERTGLNVIRVEIDTINFLNDTAKLKMLYQPPETCVPEVEKQNGKTTGTCISYGSRA
ncbi:MAG: DUF4956 domain-containing protein [Desulfobacteraceae bacterium]|jgi:hypothetical protein